MKGRGDLSKAVSLFIGTTIGAGIFGMPYVFAKAGYLTGLLNLLVLGLIVFILNLSVGEVALRTKKTHMLAGYAEKYLGKWGKTVMALSALFGTFGALIAYLIGEGEALSAIFGFKPLLLSLIFFVIVSILIWFDLKAVSESDLILNLIMLAVVLVICGVVVPKADLSNLTAFNPKMLFVPYGVVLFALLGASSIPEMEEQLRKKKGDLKKAIMVGTLITFAVYILFTLAVVGVNGAGTTEVATIGLGNVFGRYMMILVNVFAILAMGTSFLSLGLALKWMMHYDYGLSKAKSWAITCFIPLLIFLAGAKSFIWVIGITGAVAGGVEGIMLILTAKAAKKKGEMKPAYSIDLNWLIVAIIALLFLAGIISQFM